MLCQAGEEDAPWIYPASCCCCTINYHTASSTVLVAVSYYCWVGRSRMNNLMHVSGEDAPWIYPASLYHKLSHSKQHSSCWHVVSYCLVDMNIRISMHVHSRECTMDLPSKCMMINFLTEQAAKFLLLFHIVWLTWIESTCMHLERMHQAGFTNQSHNKFSHRYKFKSMHTYMRGCTMYLPSSFATNSHIANSHSCCCCCFILFGYQE